MNTNRWGIIYCPMQGIVRTHRRWERIQAALNARGVEYDFVQSDTRGSVERLSAMLASNGYRTIIVVGGDVALNQAVNGIISVGMDVAKATTIGVIPNGRGNDYARYWGFHEDNEEETVEALVRGRVRKVDLGLFRCFDAEGKTEESRRYFLNSVNLGLVAHIMNLRHKTYRFWGMSTLSYVSSFLILLFHRMECRMHLRINYEDLNRSMMTVCMGCCRNYGLTPNAVPYNGMLDVSIVSQPEVLKLISGMWMLISGRFLNNKSVTPYRTRSAIRILSRGTAKVSIDGYVKELPDHPLEVSVLQEYLNFIIPS